MDDMDDMDDSDHPNIIGKSMGISWESFQLTFIFFQRDSTHQSVICWWIDMDYQWIDMDQLDHGLIVNNYSWMIWMIDTDY